jgi:co-chaperonin GroES (HSP10)
MNIQPLKSKVLIAETKRDKTTASGIIIEGKDAGGDSRTGKVISVGPDVTQVKEGDEVYLVWSKGTVVKVDDAYRIIIDEENIVAVLEK